MNNMGIPLIMNFICFTQRIAKTIKNSFNIQSANHRTNSIFNNNSILVAFKEKRNCEITLFVSNSTVIITSLKHLTLLIVTDHDATLAVKKTILLEAKNRIWNAIGSYICISSNVIYTITYTCCEKIYIGETKM